MNACQACGACCATLRVSFPAEEVDSCHGGWVPDGLVEPYGNVLCMKTAADGRCIALQGTIGQSVSCRIYAQRPTSCRDFSPLAVLGWGDLACDDARRRRGLAPLAAEENHARQ